MTTKAITIRLDERMIEKIDALAIWTGRRFDRQAEERGMPSIGQRHPTRSDVIRTMLTGYLMDHEDLIERVLSEVAADRDGEA